MTEITAGTEHVTMPGLRAGAGETPQDGACIMQAAAWLAMDGAWTDMPACVHPALRKVAIAVNDTVRSGARQQLWPLIPRLTGTGPTGNRQADARVSVGLAAWSAERVLPLIKDQQRHQEAAARIGRARAWLEDPHAPAAAAAYAADAAAAAYAADAADAYAADAAAYAADAAARAADAAAAAYAYAYAAAAAAAYAAYAYAAAAAAYDDDADQARIQFLTDLIGEYDRITGRTAPAEIPAARWQQLAAILTGSATGAEQ